MYQYELVDPVLDTYLTPKWVCNLYDQKIIPNFILRMSNVIRY